MATETRTTEQQNEHEAKAMLAGALNMLRSKLDATIYDLEEAIEVFRSVKASLKRVPFVAHADSIDLDAVTEAVRLANAEWPNPINVRPIQEDINRAASYLTEAVGQVDYLEAGDFSE